MRPGWRLPGFCDWGSTWASCSDACLSSGVRCSFSPGLLSGAWPGLQRDAQRMVPLLSCLSVSLEQISHAPRREHVSVGSDGGGQWVGVITGFSGVRDV